MRGSHRARLPRLVIRDIETLAARHSARCIMFGDDCIPPKTLAALSRGLPRARTEISWQCEARFEPSLTGELLKEAARAGCRNITFGLESHSPRVLALMNKGVRHREIRLILDDCRRSGIAFNLQLFFGFPGESSEDAGQTIDFVLGEMHGAATCSFGLFRLLRGSNLGRHPEAFGIHPLEPAPGLLCERMEYGPLPEHAEEARNRLRREVLSRTRHPYAAFSLDAHTLLFLHHAGVEKMSREYYRPSKTDPIGAPDDDRSETLPLLLVRKEKQSVLSLPPLDPKSSRSGRILVYDYDLDETVELSRLGVWVLQQFNAPKAPGEPALQASQAAATSAEKLRVSATVNGLVAELFRRGLLVASGDS